MTVKNSDILVEHVVFRLFKTWKELVYATSGYKTVKKSCGNLLCINPAHFIKSSKRHADMKMSESPKMNVEGTSSFNEAIARIKEEFPGETIQFCVKTDSMNVATNLQDNDSQLCANMCNLKFKDSKF